MLRVFLLGLTVLALLPCALRAQATLVPSDRAPYRQRFDLQAQDAQFLLLPQSPRTWGEGPFRFRFDHPALQELLEAAPTTTYLTAREGGFVLQVLHLRSRSVAPEVFGPQRFFVENAAGERVGHGVLLVAGRAPEGIDLLGADGSRVFEVSRSSPVRILLRTHGNYGGEVQLLNTRDWEMRNLRPEADSAGIAVFTAELRPLRADATELRLGIETRDGRQVDVAFPGISVRPPAPRRVRVVGGPLYLDPSGRGVARIQVPDLGAEAGTPEIIGDAGGELSVLEQRFDGGAGVLDAQVEFVARTPRQPGTREVRDLPVRSGTQTFRGLVEIVAAPVVASARTEGQSRALLGIGSGVSVLRVSGQNLDALRLDCSGLGPPAECRTVSASPGELVAEVSLPGGVREGEHLLPLVGDAGRGTAGASPLGVVRIQAEYPSIPLPLAAAPFVRVGCAPARSCRRSGDAVRVAVDAASGLRLVFDEAEIPAEHGWQKLVVTVIRVRGENRQIVRTFGSATAPRMVRRGSPAGELLLIDAGADPRHGDLFLVRVEHAAEQYAPEHRMAVASADAQVHRVYIDGGASKRITGDIAVQPVLFGLGGGGESGVDVLYPNAGFGVTWQALNDRLEPRLFSTKLQFLVTNLQAVKGSAGAGGRPALFVSGNLRIPGADPNRPLTLTTGVARMLGDEGGWRMLAGAGMDLGVARMIFGQ